eukprot:g2293.t1
MSFKKPQNINVEEIVWQYKSMNGGQWTDFNIQEADEIEGQFFMKEDFTLGNSYYDKWLFDFSSMECVKANNSHERRQIRRHSKLSPSELRQRRNKNVRDEFLAQKRKRDKAEKMFTKYEYSSAREEGYPCRIIADPGLTQFWKDLGSQNPAEDARLLCLAWNMDADAMVDDFGFTVYKESEFYTGLANLSATTIPELNKSLTKCFKEIINAKNIERFDDFYKFCYRYTLPFLSGGRGKNMPLMSAVSLWRLLLPLRGYKLVNEWLNFVTERPDLDEDEERENVSCDLWNMTLVFFENLQKEGVEVRSEGGTTEIVGFESAGIYPDEIECFYEYLISGDTIDY